MLGRQGQGADARRAGDADHPQGSQLGQGAAAQGPRLHRQGRQARRPAGRAVQVDLPAGRRGAASHSPSSGTAAATRALRLGFSACRHEGLSPSIARSTAQAARQHRGARSASDVAREAETARISAGGGQAGRDRRLQRRLHPRRQSRLSLAAGAVPLLHPRGGRRPASRPNRRRRADGRDDPRPASARRRRASLRGPIEEVLERREPAPLLWFGAIVGLWTAASFIETIRDILRRAYGVKYCAPASGNTGWRRWR